MTTTRTQLLEQLAAAATNLAIATHFEHEKIREYDLMVDYRLDGTVAPDADLTPFIWRMENAKEARMSAWHKVDALKAQIIELDEIAAALDAVKAEMRDSRRERYETAAFHVFCHKQYDNEFSNFMREACTYAAEVFNAQIVAHL